MLGNAAIGAALGAAGGAIAGDASAGAAIGALASTMIGGLFRAGFGRETASPPPDRAFYQ